MHQTILFSACESKNVEVIKYLISLNAFDLSTLDHDNIYIAIICNTILHEACKYGSIDIIKYLVSLNEIDINSKNIFLFANNISDNLN